MRDDQADELTAATYVRETGYSDEVLCQKGLLRNASRSKRGALIGHEARPDLWDHFNSGAVNKCLAVSPDALLEYSESPHLDEKRRAPIANGNSSKSGLQGENTKTCRP